MRDFKVQLSPPAANIYGYQFYLSLMSSRVSAPPWNIDLTPFYLAHLKTILNMSDHLPPFMSNQASKFWRTWLSPPLKCILVQKSNTHFLKKQKILFPALKNKNTFECWNMNMQLQNLKIKGDLVTDSKGIFNTDSRNGVSKLSGLRWFLLFEDLKQGSLQANEASKKY